MPYMEQQHLLQKRNRALEAALKRASAELAELREGEEPRRRAIEKELAHRDLLYETQAASYEAKLRAAQAAMEAALEAQHRELTGEAAESERARRQREKQVAHLDFAGGEMALGANQLQ